MTSEETRAHFMPKLHAISIDDGISLDEADVIAAAYYFRFALTGYGEVSTPVIDDGQDWIAEALIGDRIIKHFWFLAVFSG